MKEHTWIPSRGKRLSVMIHSPDGAAAAPVVVLCHGFTGDKVGANQLMRNLAQTFEAAGFCAVRFDFAGSGDSEGTFAADTTVAGWQQDLRSVAAWVGKNLPGRPVYLLGHSLGGLIVLTAGESGVAGRIAIAPVVHAVENFVTILGSELWAKAVRGETIANFYGKGFTLDAGFTSDLQAGGYDPLGAAKAFTAPLLIVHGTADAAVPFAGSEELYAACAAPKELAVLDAADHVFIGRHHELGATIVNWLQRQNQ